MAITRNRKADGMGINVIVTLAIAVIILLLVGVFLSGGFGALTGKVRGFGSGTTAQSQELGELAGCNQICTSWMSEGCKSGTGSYDKARGQCNATDYPTLKAKCDCEPW